MYNLFTSLVKQSFKQYLVTFSKTTYLVEALIHRYTSFHQMQAMLPCLDNYFVNPFAAVSRLLHVSYTFKAIL